MKIKKLVIVRPMWWIEYEDYKPDQPLVKDQVAPLQGIVGCEMHDLNGWGLKHHVYKEPKPGYLRQILNLLLGTSNNK